MTTQISYDRVTTSALLKNVVVCNNHSSQSAVKPWRAKQSANQLRMKRIKNAIVGAMIFMVVVFCANAQVTVTSGNYEITIYAVRGPLKSNGNWRNWAGPTTDEIDRGVTINDIGGRFDPSMVSQRLPNLDNDTLWFPVKIRALNGATITPNMLRFSQRSSDFANVFANSATLVGSNSSYTPETIGRNSSGERVSSGNGNVPMLSLSFIGLQGTYLTYSNQAENDNLNNYIYSNAIALTTTVEVVGSNGQVLASASRTLNVNNQPGLLSLSIRKQGNQIVIPFQNARPGVQLTLQTATPSNLGHWTTFATTNSGSGSGQFGPIEVFGRRFFRIQQPPQ